MPYQSEAPGIYPQSLQSSCPVIFGMLQLRQIFQTCIGITLLTATRVLTLEILKFRLKLLVHVFWAGEAEIPHGLVHNSSSFSD